jgi:hypothetical protein
MGALLRDANTRYVWLVVRPDEIRALFPELLSVPRALRGHVDRLVGPTASILAAGGSTTCVPITVVGLTLNAYLGLVGTVRGGNGYRLTFGHAADAMLLM